MGDEGSISAGGLKDKTQDKSQRGMATGIPGIEIYLNFINESLQRALVEAEAAQGSLLTMTCTSFVGKLEIIKWKDKLRILPHS